MHAWRAAAAGGHGMKALALAGVLAAAMVAVTASPSEAWHHGRLIIGVGVGPYWGWAYPGPYYYGYPYGYYRYGYPYPPAVVEEPRVYVQQPPSAADSPPPSVSVPPEEAYWYYCPNAREYYPNVPSCSEAWVRVPARSR